MPGTVDDFMARFGGAQTVTDEDAAHFHDRFVSTKPDDHQFDSQTYHAAATEYLGKLPDDQFHQAAGAALAQAPAEERHGLLGGLLGALTGGSSRMGGSAIGGGSLPAAGGIAGLASMLGLSSSDPSQMSQSDATRVMDYARREQPAALQQTVAEKPWFLKALGNPVVMGALTMAAAKMVQGQQRGGGGGLFN